MLCLSQSVGYAVRALTCLESGDCGTRFVQEIAVCADVPPAYLAKIFKRLVDAGILQSKRGPRGGTRLARPPESINLLGIVEAVDGPGVVSFALGWGHWATGSSDMVIDGEVIKGDSRRGGGLHANAAMWIDPALKNTCLFDPVGGSVSFYDTHIRLEKMPAGTLPPQRGRVLQKTYA